MACYLISGPSEAENFTKIVDGPYPWTIFAKKIHLILQLRGSEFDSDLKQSDKEYITIDIFHMIYCVVKVIYKRIKEKEVFYSEKEKQFPDEFISFFLFLFSN